MKLFAKMAAGVAGAVMMSTAAMAADPMPVYVPPMMAPVVVAPATHNWDGTYFGVATMPGFYTLGQFGVNWTPGNFLVGVVARGGFLWDWPPAAIGTLSLRAGAILGAQDRALLYGVAGVGGAWLPGSGAGVFMTAGAGAEFAVNDRISVFGESRLVGSFGGMGGGLGCCITTIGINIHR